MSPKTSSISRYRKCTKTTSFSILGFFSPWVKLGFDFPGVLINQKNWPWYLKFYFYEERNHMLGSLKNSSCVKSPNFPQQWLKMPRIKFCLNKKIHPSMESYPSLLFLWRETKKVRSPSFCSCRVSSSQVSSNTMLDFYHLVNMILGSYLRE